MRGSGHEAVELAQGNKGPRQVGGTAAEQAFQSTSRRPVPSKETVGTPGRCCDDVQCF